MPKDEKQLCSAFILCSLLIYYLMGSLIHPTPSTLYPIFHRFSIVFLLLSNCSAIARPLFNLYPIPSTLHPFLLLSDSLFSCFFCTLHPRPFTLFFTASQLFSYCYPIAQLLLDHCSTCTLYPRPFTLFCYYLILYSLVFSAPFTLDPLPYFSPLLNCFSARRNFFIQVFLGKYGSITKYFYT